MNDPTGATAHLAVKNTGATQPVAGVAIGQPSSFWTVDCGAATPAGWTANESPSGCFFTSQSSINDLAPGQTLTFDLSIKTRPAKYNHASTFAVFVSSTSSFANAATVKQAGAMGSGLRVRAHVFEILDAIVADAAAVAGAACPATNHAAPAAASGKVVIVCGMNRASVTLVPKQYLSILGGTLVASHGSFTSGPVAPGATSVVLGNWSNVTLAGTPASGLTIAARIGSLVGRNSAMTALSGYEATGSANASPVAGDDSYNVNQDTQLSIDAPGVLDNDADADADSLTAAVVTDVAHGSLTLNANGSFSYQPTALFVGLDSFTYTADDGTAVSNTATVTITVDAVVANTAPVANDDSATLNKNTTLNAPAPGVLADDTDADSDELTAVLVTNVAHGALTLNSDGSFSYQPTANYVGADSFTYTAFDGAANSNTATVNLSVEEPGGGGGGGGCLIASGDGQLIIVC